MSATKVIMREEDLNQIESAIKYRMNTTDELSFPNDYVSGIHDAPDIFEMIIGGELEKYVDYGEDVPMYLFYQDRNVKEIDCPKATIVMENAFSGSSIALFKLPKVCEVKQSAFSDCNAVISIDLPSAIIIHNGAFYSCDNLKKVELDSIEYIDISFSYCNSLETVVIRQFNHICTLGGIYAFQNTKINNGEGFIYVPDALVNDYKTATNWSVYANQIKPLSEYTGLEGV